MNWGSRIVGLRPGDAAVLAEAAPVREESIYPAPDPTADDAFYSDGYDARGSRRLGWLRPATAIALCLGWVGGATAFAWPELQPPVPARLVIEFIAALCVPPALLGITWMLAMRTSTAEAQRFGSSARGMRREAESLDRTIAMLAARLDENRAQLAEQTNALLAMGDGAAERLAAISNGMAQEMRAVEAHAARLTDTAAGAQSKLGVLLSSLPRAHADTDDIAKALERTARNAGEHAADLEAQVHALAERGREADLLANGAAQRLAAHITRMDATSESAGARLEAVVGDMSATVDTMLDRTAGGVDEARKSIATQGEAMLAMLEANQIALDRASRESVTALGERMAALEIVIDRIGAQLNAQRATGDDLLHGLNAGIVDVGGRLDALHAQGVSRTQDLAASISALGGSADAMTEALRQGDAMGRSVIGTAEEVLTALDAAAREIDETLPEALARLDARLGESRKVVAASKPELLALVTAAESTHTAIEAIAEVIAGQRDTLDELSGTLLETLNSGRAKADALGHMVDETIERTENFARDAAPQLVEALLRVRDTAAAAADRARETLAAVIPEVTQTLEDASGAAMKRALSGSVERHVQGITDAAENAVSVAERASERLTQQMLAIAEASAAVEVRIEDARAEREKADTDSFARRASLLVESLNSAAIDIVKSYSHEVSDSAWAAYLKGDRGVFTRRAVRLLDSSDAREVARLYDDDHIFREQVNRYIHDFEAMLRGVLMQRDGSPLGVTLLSSDMGKLYVAMAQAIERLRS